MGRPEYADVQWLWWLRKIGAVDALREGRLPDSWYFFRWSWHLAARRIMQQCIQVPAAYWPQVVDEECKKLLAGGTDRETLKRVRHWLERELTI